jgi:hypothetical protein
MMILQEVQKSIDGISLSLLRSVVVPIWCTSASPVYVVLLVFIIKFDEGLYA